MATPRLCSDIQLIDKTECIGNSLVKINRNFSSLRSDICNIVDSFNPLINVTGLVKGTGTSFTTAVQNVDYYKPNTVLQYPLSITGAFSCGGTATITGDTTINSNLTVGSASRLTNMRLTGEFRIKDLASTKGIYFAGNQVNASPETQGPDELALNYVGFNGGVTQFRHLNVYNGKKQSLMFVDGSNGKITMGSPGSRGDLLTVYGNISATGVVYGGSINTSINITSLSAPGANDGDVLTYVVQNVITNNPTTSNPVITPSTARFNTPHGIVIDSFGNFYVTDYTANTVRKITPSGVVSTLAGTAGQAGIVDAIGLNARFNKPLGISVDFSGNFYLSDFEGFVIRKITPAGVVSTFAGAAGQRGNTNGTGSGARFSSPHGTAVDRFGNVYVADHLNHIIRKITPAGVVTTVAGTGARGNQDGVASVATLDYPIGIAIDPIGNLYVTQYYNHTIRKITPTGVVTTIAGQAGSTGSSDGPGTTARFNGPAEIDIDFFGNIYVADSGNHTIRKMTPTGIVSTIAGLAGSIGSADGVGTAARFNTPSGIAIDSSGNLYVTDSYNHTIRKVTPAGEVSTIAGVAGQSGSADGLTTQVDIVVGIPLVTQVGSWVPRPMTIELPKVANNKDVLTYNSTTSRWVAAAVPGDAPNSITLDKLSTAGATAGNIIAYNPATMQWAPAVPPSGLPTTAANNQVLVYDTTARGWMPKDISNVLVPTLSLKKNEITTATNVASYPLTLSATDANPENYLVYLNGVMQSPGTDYTISPNGRITLIPAPAGALKLTVMAVRTSTGVASPSPGGSGSGSGTSNSGLSPGAEGQVLTYINSQWVGATPSVLPSQIRQGGATAGQILSYNGSSWVPTTNAPSVSPAQLQTSGARHGQVLMFNSITNTWAPSSISARTTVNINNNNNNNQTVINEENLYINSEQLVIYKLCETTLYSNPHEYADGFGFIDSNKEVRICGDSIKFRFGPNDIGNVNGYGTLPLPAGEDAEKLYIDRENVLVVTLSGNVFISGENREGQLANGNPSLSSSVVLQKATVLSNIKELYLAPSLFSSAPTYYALNNEGSLYAWGANRYGSIGDSTTTNKFTPIITLGPGNSYGNPTSKVIQVITFPGYSELSPYTTTVALLEDGSVWSVGFGSRGNLGNGTTTMTNSKWVRVKISSTADLTRIQKICGAGNFGLTTVWALDFDGKVWAWGLGGSGQIGDGSNTNIQSYATPMMTSHLTPAPIIVDFYPVCGDSSSRHGVYLKDSTGKWYACGGNEHGGFGLGNTTNVNRMTLIPSLVGKNVQYITAANYGGYHAFAVAPDALYATQSKSAQPWGAAGLGDKELHLTFDRVRLKAKSDANQLLDVRPVHVPTLKQLSTYVFSRIDRKLYMAGSLAWETVPTVSRVTEWKVRCSFQEITRGVV